MFPISKINNLKERHDRKICHGAVFFFMLFYSSAQNSKTINTLSVNVFSESIEIEKEKDKH